MDYTIKNFNCTLKVSELDAVMNGFVSAAKDGTFKEKGFPGSTYVMSKIGLSTLTRIQQQVGGQSKACEDVICVRQIFAGL